MPISNGVILGCFQYKLNSGESLMHKPAVVSPYPLFPPHLRLCTNHPSDMGLPSIGLGEVWVGENTVVGKARHWKLSGYAFYSPAAVHCSFRLVYSKEGVGECRKMRGGSFSPAERGVTQLAFRHVSECLGGLVCTQEFFLTHWPIWNLAPNFPEGAPLPSF